ncbi:uncharacterized protein C2orf15 homolog isoform X1 [Arvicanthis niloticus]|uniref:uncharacterized protein C2orf15 homolog isoform X1 n=1 Tax=Arvicanthis niloticus TaxID=61156 RepID=UPI00402B95D5
MADPCVPSPSNHPSARPCAEAAETRMCGGRRPALEHLLRSQEPQAFVAEGGGYALELLSNPIGETFPLLKRGPHTSLMSDQRSQWDFC